MADPFLGQITMFAANFAPRNWALCDGQLLPISQHQALFAILGTIYGGDGRTTFGLPDLRGRVPVHAGSGPGLDPHPLGQKAGVEMVTLTANQIPTHTHGMLKASRSPATEKAVYANMVAAGGGLRFGADGSTSTMAPSPADGGGGGGEPHSNLQPTQCINFIIALQGVFPSRS